MRRNWRTVCVAVVGALVVSTALSTPTASASGTAQGSVPSAVPPAWTPQVADGAVRSFGEVGSNIVVGGTFSSLNDASANGGTAFAQKNVFAFDENTGAVNRNFRPTVNGAVNAIVPGPNDTVYIGGTFTTVNGTARSRVAQLNLSNGQLTTFTGPSLNSAVKDMGMAHGLLYVGGTFTTAGGQPRGGLATLDQTTGALTNHLTVMLAGHHNYDGTTATKNQPVGVEKLDVSPLGDQMMVIGNFKTADGNARDQAVRLLLDGTGAATVDAGWATQRYTPACAKAAFDDYMRAIQYSPDGTYFVISTTGAAFNGTLCDTVTRWESSVPASSNQQPTWISYTGGDSIYSLALSGTAVFAGGHPRWLNNNYGHDSAGAGAVPRPGLGAFDPRTGLPIAWNPGRNPRGHGAEALLVTAKGLYVGSDTDYIGNRKYLRKKVAFFPLADGYALPPEHVNGLPGNVVMAGRPTAVGGVGVNDVVSRPFDGTTPGADSTLGNAGVDWGQAKGGFLVDGTLYYGFQNPNDNNTYYLYRRSFDGSSFGPATVVDPYNDPLWSTVSAGTKNGVTSYYRGAIPDFYTTDLQRVTGMFFAGGRLYYTKSGSNSLFMRPFSTDSGVVGAVAQTVATNSAFGDVAGMFLDGNTLYLASTSGALRSVAFTGNSVSGPVGTVDTSRNWASEVMVVG